MNVGLTGDWDKYGYRRAFMNYSLCDEAPAEARRRLDRLTGTDATPITGGYAGMHHEVSGIAEYDNFQIIPEPATMCLLAIGGIGILLRRRDGSLETRG